MNDLLFQADRIKINRAEPVHIQIEKALRHLIKSNLLNPGDRIPSAEDLAVSLTVHPATVQKALRRLKTSGLVVRTPRLGTFVKCQQESMTVAVVFGPSLTDESSHFFRALLRALRGEVATSGWHYRSYDGLNASRDEASPNPSPLLAQMARDREIDRYSGLIAVSLGGATPPSLLSACGTSTAVSYGMAGDVRPDVRDFTSSSVDFLAGQGRKRIVYFRTLFDKADTGEDLQGLQTAARRHGMEDIGIVHLPRRRAHYDEGPDRAFCQSLTEQWSEEDLWPDGIIMSDDITMRGLAHALIARGPERVARVSVVSWANEGIQLHYGLPVNRYVLSSTELARQLTMLLEKRMMGHAQSASGMAVRGKIYADVDGEFAGRAIA